MDNIGVNLMLAGIIIVLLFALYLAWQITDYFIPPRYNWVKSPVQVFMIKLGIAAGIVFWTFQLIVFILSSFE